VRKAPPLTRSPLRQEGPRLCLERRWKARRRFPALGIWADWDDAYLTLQRARAPRLGVFGQMVLAGPHLTGPQAVALRAPKLPQRPGRGQIDYPTATRPRFYVAFPGDRGYQRHGPGAGRAWHQPEQRSLWGLPPLGTRLPGGARSGDHTPWTLPANLAVSAERTLDYAICRAVRNRWRRARAAEATCQAPLDRGRRPLVESLQTAWGCAWKPL